MTESAGQQANQGELYTREDFHSLFIDFVLLSR